MRSGVTKPAATARAGLHQLARHQHVDVADAGRRARAPAGGRQLAPRAPAGSRCNRWWRRCAARRPGSRSICTGKPSASAARTIQSVSTPPPSPPSAAIRSVTGAVAHVGSVSGAVRTVGSLSAVTGVRVGMRGAALGRCVGDPLTAVRSPAGRGSSWHDRVALQQADELLARPMQHAVPGIRIAHDLGAIERRAQHGGVRDLAAQPAADAALDHGRDRIGAQRIGIGLDRQRRAARQPDAGMVAGADLVVDAEARPHHARAALELLGVLGAHAALARKLAFAVGDDHLEPALGGAHRLLERLRHLGDRVGAHLAQPGDAERAQRLLDVHAGRGALAARPCSTACIAGRSPTRSRSASRSARRRPC